MCRCMHVCRQTDRQYDTQKVLTCTRNLRQKHGEAPNQLGQMDHPILNLWDYSQGPNRVWICDTHISQSGVAEDLSLLESYIMWTNKELLLFQMITVPPTAWSSSPRTNFSWTASLQSTKTRVIIYQLTKCHIPEDGNLQNLLSPYRQKENLFPEETGFKYRTRTIDKVEIYSI